MSESISARMRDINIEWLTRAAEFNHLFNTRWLGERFFHLPGDMLAIQELVWRIRPTAIVQTGIAAGGGVVYSASMLELTADDRDGPIRPPSIGPGAGTTRLDRGPIGHAGQVFAVEPRLRPEVRERLQSHRLAHRMQLLEGESCADATLAAIRARIADDGPVLVILDLTHTHDHVLRELACYAELVTPGSYIVVMDTIMEYLPEEMFHGKPYGRGNNPATAVRAFLADDDRFQVDSEIEDRVIMTLSPGGFLKRVR